MACTDFFPSVLLDKFQSIQPSSRSSRPVDPAVSPSSSGRGELVASPARQAVVNWSPPQLVRPW